MAASYGFGDFLRALQALLPPGDAWPRDPDALLTRLLEAVALRYEAHQARVAQFLDVESFPPSAGELLADWERVFGLPDECAGPADGAAARRAALVARVIERGGQSPAYYIGIAAALGFSVTITEFRQARIGLSAIGEPIHGPEWTSTWRVNAPPTAVVEARIGISTIGDPLREFGNALLGCVLHRIKPAHTHLIISSV